MEAIYSQITGYMVEAGEQMLSLQGNIADIGATKKHVTKADLRIEHDLVSIIQSDHPDHMIYAEEEHDTFPVAENIWFIDPISGTRAFIEGRPHYASVVAHYKNGIAQFAAVYDPSADELYNAQRGRGAYLNGEPIHVSTGTETLLQNIAKSRYDSDDAVRLRAATRNLRSERNEASFAVNYCWVAAGRRDCVFSIAKDSFPEFAGALILEEAGGMLTNLQGESVRPEDRLFVGGNPAMHAKLLNLSQVALGLKPNL